MVTSNHPPAAPPRLIPTGPSIEAWRAMAPSAREAFLLEVIDALSDPRDMMSEGRPHKKARVRAIDLLSLHFKAMGRVVYLAEEMAVVYPGEESFSPDVLAVVDVPQPEDDERMAWVFADEGRGLDLAVQEGTLRFFQGMAELFGTDNLIDRLTGMVGSLEAKADAQAARAEQEAARAQDAVAGLRAGVLAAFATRRVPCPDDVRARLTTCDDPATLQRWLLRALTVDAAAEALDE